MKHFTTMAMLLALLCTAAAITLLAGCGTPEKISPSSSDSGSDTAVLAPESPAASASSSAASQPDSSSEPVLEPEIAPDARFKLENYDYQDAELENYRSIGAQFYTDHMGAEVRDVPYDLAAAIYQYRDFHNSLIFTGDFREITTIQPTCLIEIAAARAPHIDLFAETFQAATDAHPVKKFFLSLKKKNGQAPGLIAYGEDVRAKAKELFGEQYDLPAGDGLRIYYEPTLDLYYYDGAIAPLATDYPVVVEWNRTDDLYTVKVIRLSFWEFRNSWSTPDGTWESSENCTIEEVRTFVNSNFNTFPQDTYFLSGSDRESLRVVGYAQG